jgi:hypothetical protein
VAKLLAVGLVLLAMAGPARAQIDPALYALAHQLSIIQGAPTSQAGRGGAGVAVREPWGGNPSALQTRPGTAWQYHHYSFEEGLDAGMVSWAAVYPTGRWDFVLSMAELRSTRGSLPLPGLSLDLHESDLSLQIGYRVNSRLSLGLGAAPAMDVTMHITSPLGQVAELSSKPRAGFRLGGLWEIGDGWSAGGYYDNYLEAVDLQMTGAPAARNTYRSEFGRYGIAKRLGRWLLAADHSKGRLFGAPSTAKCDDWLYGADYQIAPAWTVRGGLFHRQPSAGLSYGSGRLAVLAAQCWCSAAS